MCESSKKNIIHTLLNAIGNEKEVKRLNEVVFSEKELLQEVIRGFESLKWMV